MRGSNLFAMYIEMLATVYDHNCHRCPLHDVGNRWVCVPGRGNPKSKRMIIGEAPGAKEDEQGAPFVGASGQFLDQALQRAGLDPFRDVFITNVVKCRPPDNRTPTDSEIRRCSDYLVDETVYMQPISVMACGQTALRALTGEKTGIVNAHGNWRMWMPPDRAPPARLMACVHPSWVLHGRSVERESFFQGAVNRFASN